MTTSSTSPASLRVKGVEIGANLAALARQRLAEFGDHADIEHADFESWESGGRRFDAVFSCNAFHWIDPDLRLSRAASLLEPGGHLAVIGTPWVIPTDADHFWWDVQDDYEAVGGVRVDPPTAHPDRVKDLAPLVVRSGCSTNPSHDDASSPPTPTPRTSPPSRVSRSSNQTPALNSSLAPAAA